MIGYSRPTHRLVWHHGSSSKIEHYKALASQEMKTESLTNNDFDERLSERLGMKRPV